MLPVVDSLKIPVRGIVIIMLAFVIIIGPVNIIYLNRRKRRIWMLWTIPAISFATTLLVFAYSLLREGITPDTRIAGLTVMDQTSHRAATIGGTAFYCPLTPSGGLHFDFETEATPLVQSGNGSGTSREVDWTQSQHFQRGWVSARVPAYFHLRKSETRARTDADHQRKWKIANRQRPGRADQITLACRREHEIFQANELPPAKRAASSFQPVARVQNHNWRALFTEAGFTAKLEPLDAGHGKIPRAEHLHRRAGRKSVHRKRAGSASSPKRTKSSAVVFGILESPETR